MHQGPTNAPDKKNAVRIAVTFTPKPQDKYEEATREITITSSQPEHSKKLRKAVQNSNQATNPADPSLPETPKKEIFLDFELDTQPAPAEELALDPQELIPKEMVGRMVLELFISKEGQVLWSNITASDFDDRTNQQLSSEFRATRFIPGAIAGTPVDALIRVEIERTN